jgi:TonB family protein
VTEETMVLRLIISVMFLGCALASAAESTLMPKAAVAPKYPPLGAMARVSGTVVVRVTIDAFGNVTKAEAVAGHNLLKQAAVDAARKWKFESELRGTRTAELKFRFSLLPERQNPDVQTTFFPPDEIEVELTPATPTVNYGRGR